MTARRWVTLLAVLLAVSAGINLFVLGFGVALWRNAPGIQSAVEMGRIYPPEIRRAVFRTVMADRAELRRRVEAYRRARAEMIALMRQPELDRPALEAAMERVRTAVTALQAGGHAALVEVLAETPAELRAEIEEPPVAVDLDALEGPDG